MFFCNFLFLLRFCFYNCKCRRYFFLFLSKGLFKRFFYHKLLFFLLCLSKCFCLHFFSCCNFVFYSCKICVTFPLCYRKIFGWFFNRIFTENCLLFAFLRHFASRACTLQENPSCSSWQLPFYFTNFFCNRCSIFYNLLLKIKNFHIKNAVTTVFFTVITAIL